MMYLTSTVPLRHLMWLCAALSIVCMGFGCQKNTLKNKKKDTAVHAAQVKGERVQLGITGMTCSGCVKHITAALKNTQGVRYIRVTLKPPRASITYDAKQTNIQKLIAAIDASGYKAHTLKVKSKTRSRTRPVKTRSVAPTK